MLRQLFIYFTANICQSFRRMSLRYLFAHQNSSVICWEPRQTAFTLFVQALEEERYLLEPRTNSWHAICPGHRIIALFVENWIK